MYFLAGKIFSYLIVKDADGNYDINTSAVENLRAKVSAFKSKIDKLKSVFKSEFATFIKNSNGVSSEYLQNLNSSNDSSVELRNDSKIVNNAARQADNVTSDQSSIVKGKKSKYEVKVGFELSDRQSKIFSKLKETRKINMKQISMILPEVSERTLRRDMKVLESLGLVKQVGRTKNSFYVIA